MRYLFILLIMASCNTNADTQPKIFDSAKPDGTIAADTAIIADTLQQQ